MSIDAASHPSIEAIGDRRGRIDELEAVIAQGLATFIDVGRALLEIQHNKLYRAAGYRSFATYVTDRWGLSPGHAYRQIEAARVVDALSPIGEIPLPSNEAQARELAPLTDDPQALRDVWREAVAANGGRVTAKAIRARVAERVTPTEGSTAKRPLPRRSCPQCGYAWVDE